MTKIEAMASEAVVWPHRYAFFSSMGYVVWRDVFEGDMRCALKDAVMAHKVAVFVLESDAKKYCNFRSAAAIRAAKRALR